MFNLHYADDNATQKQPTTTAELVERRLPKRLSPLQRAPAPRLPQEVGDIRRPLFAKLDGMPLEQLQIELARCASTPALRQSFYRDVVEAKIRELGA
jgi:hypothetical protein